MRPPVWPVLVPASVASLHLAALLAAAARGKRRPPPARTGKSPHLAVLIPAHNEQAGLGDTLAAIAALDYPAGLLTTVVIADNCSDATASIGRSAGVVVLERNDVSRRGKPYALAWALKQLDDAAPGHDAVLVVDADCEVMPELANALTRRLGPNARAVQADYRVANPAASTTAALRYAGFALENYVRPLARDSLGLSSGLLGTGMLFDAALLREFPWRAMSLAEDAEYHLRLVLAGERVAFAREASVKSDMPTSASEGASQEERWEAGTAQLTREFVLPLLRAGLRRRDPVRLHAAVEQMMPPQALLAVANAAGIVLAVAARDRRGIALGAVGVAAQSLFVLGGLRLATAPPSVYRALAAAPALVIRKLKLFGRIARGHTETEWVRTERPSS